MSHKKKPTSTDAVAAPSEYTTVTSREQRNTSQAQNCLLVWLDASIDQVKNKDSIETISKLREVLNAVHTFTNVDECINFINDINEGKIFIITSGAFGQTTVAIIHDKPQINTIYIFCGNKSRHEQWAREWPKVKGVFTDIKPICEALKTAVQECDQNAISPNFVATSGDATNQNVDQLDQSFMYTQILKEILLSIEFDEVHFKEFIDYCRNEFAHNDVELENIKRFEQKYRDETPIWWYTNDCFLCPMLNRVLSIMGVDIIIKLGFFLSDLHRHIAQLHSEQYAGHHHSDSFTVYRGQGLSQTDFGQLIKTKGGLFSFNIFLSTCKERQIALPFVEIAITNPDLVGVLFVMKIDPSVSSTPFADISEVSYYPTEKEILFSMHSVFRVGEIKQIDGNNRLWQVDLSLTSDTDPQLSALTEYIRKESLSNANGWHRLSELLIKMGQFDRAQQICEVLLDQVSDEYESSAIYQQLVTVKLNQGEYKEAIIFYEKAIHIQERCLSPTHPVLAISYSSMGSVYEKMGDYSKALSYQDKALEIQQKTLPPTHPVLAISYSCMGSVYEKMGDYSKTLSYQEKALEIQQKTLPPNHPDLAITYNNVGSVYEKMGEYMKALAFQGRGLTIFQKSLPPNHPGLATSYNIMGKILNVMGEYSKALSSHEKALEIQGRSLPPNHPDLAVSYNNIGQVYENMDKSSKALSFYERALDVAQRSLPSGHPDLQTYKKKIETLKMKM